MEQLLHHSLLLFWAPRQLGVTMSAFLDLSVRGVHPLRMFLRECPPLPHLFHLGFIPFLCYLCADWHVLILLRLQCYNSSRTLLAIWELSDPEAEHDAVLAIHEPGMRMVTEVMTTLILNRMWMETNWPVVIVR